MEPAKVVCKNLRQSTLISERRKTVEKEKVEKVLQVEFPRRASGAESLMMEEQKRRFSEAGVNRRPSAAHILTEVRMMRTRFDNQDVEEINIEGVCLLHRAWQGVMTMLVVFAIMLAW